MTSDPQPQPPPALDSVRAELSRILSSEVFRGSDRLTRFLEFVVSETLAGRTQSLKETSIGIEVFGRPADYDPKTDPIVRVQARRLRAKLEQYYAGEGVHATLRIELPKGGYVAEFPALAPAPLVPAGTPRVEPAAEPAFPLGARVLVGISLAVILGIGLFVARYLWTARPEAIRTRPLTNFLGYQTQPAFSPDGKSVAFRWGGPDGDNVDIWVQRLEEDTPHRVTTSPEREQRPAWSPDGTRIAFVRDEAPDRMGVFSVPLSGSGEIRVATLTVDPTDPPRIEFSPDGKWLWTAERAQAGSPTGIVAVSLVSGERRRLTDPQPPLTGDVEASLSPDGKSLAFIRTQQGLAVSDVWVMPATGGEARRVTNDKTGLAGFAWSPDGRSIIVSSRRRSSLHQLWRFSISGGEPEVLTEPALAAHWPAAGRDGRIVYASLISNSSIWRIDLTGTEPQRRLIASNLSDTGPQYSPDGKRIVFRSNRTGNDEIWTADSDGRALVRLTNFSGPVTGSPHWSPDGKWIVFDSRVDGDANIYLAPAGGGAARRLTSEKSNEVIPSFSHDGRFVYFASDRSGSWQIYRQPVAGGLATAVTTNVGFAGLESPDGRWLYFSKGGGFQGLWRLPAEGGAEELVNESLPAALWGGWGLAGDSLIYLSAAIKVKAEPAMLVIRDVKGGARQVGPTAFPPRNWDGSLGVSPDGRWALVSELERGGSALYLRDAP